MRLLIEVQGEKAEEVLERVSELSLLLTEVKDLLTEAKKDREKSDD